MGKAKNISVEDLKKCVLYDPDSGRFWGRRRPRKFYSDDYVWRSANARCEGKECFLTKIASGYLAARVLGVSIYAHRAAWAITYGLWPDHEIDHIDGNKQNNSINNLREATRRQNSWNKTSRRGSSSKYCGVVWREDRNHWYAKIKLSGRSLYLGSYAKEDDAARAYDNAAKKHFGDYAKLNFAEAGK